MNLRHKMLRVVGGSVAPPASPSIFISNYNGGEAVTVGPEPGEGVAITLDGSGNLPPDVTVAAVVRMGSETPLIFNTTIPSGYTYTALSLFAPAGYLGGYTLSLLDTAFDEFIDAGLPSGANTYSGGFEVTSDTGVVTNLITPNAGSDELSLDMPFEFGGGDVYRVYIHETGSDVRTGEVAQFWITGSDYI